MDTQRRNAPVLALNLLMLLLLAIILVGCSRDDAANAPAPKAEGPPEVGVTTLTSQRITFATELPGRTVAPVIAQIRPQVNGIIQKQLFNEGSQVKAGQVLYQLDPAVYEAEYAVARANVKKAESTYANARTMARRNRELVKIDAISAQINETSQAEAQQAAADLAVAKAQEQRAKINLDYTRIVSPIDGWIELSNVTPGALVTANQATELTTVQQLDPLYVHVSQSSVELLQLKADIEAGRLQAASENDAVIELRLENGQRYPHPGRLTFSGVTVNPDTGSITLRAQVPNPDRVLMPGMYVRAVLQNSTGEQSILVPQQAITRRPDASTVALVVDADDTLQERAVVVGRAIGDNWQVLDGLAAGERVVVTGSLHVRPGSVVRAVEAPRTPG
ncbi:efflux RND transporter periplasmic adaptor subunit [Advenella sp. S44]|uniref:efflux RND transporter periplasmic adaptor subunit n=1 Tax=Advenella sp. S44 TaxID=1982755 RepID=UPI001F5BD86A|nr:efflux RND transporter periplasmic adaptor subunit [Advenella sp. S44]